MQSRFSTTAFPPPSLAARPPLLFGAPEPQAPPTSTIDSRGENIIQTPSPSRLRRVLVGLPKRALKGGIKKVLRTVFRHRLVRPTVKLEDVTRIETAWLKQRGVKGLIFDLDETLMPHGNAILSPAVQETLASLKQQGFGCIVLSNNKNWAYGLEATHVLGLPVLCNARKPNPEGFHKALERLGLSSQEVAVVGDRPLTDILGGQRLGATTILVQSLSKHTESRAIRALRRLEGIFVLS